MASFRQTARIFVVIALPTAIVGGGHGIRAIYRAPASSSKSAGLDGPFHPPAQKSWRTCRGLPLPAAFAGVVAGPHGRIFVISGRTTERGRRRRTNAVQVYSPAGDSWRVVSPIPTARTEPGVALGADGLIYVIGGADKTGKKNVVEAYDCSRDRWTKRRPMPTPREALSAVAARGADGRVRIYAIGGRDRRKPGNGLHTVEAYDPATDTWTKVAGMPTYRHALTATLGPDGRIYAIGGSNDRVFCMSTVEIYDPVRDCWSQGPPLHFGTECAASTLVPGPDGEVVVLGGWNDRSSPLSTVMGFSPRANRWRTMPPIPTARAACGAASIRQADGHIHVFVIGGVYGESTIEECLWR